MTGRVDALALFGTAEPSPERRPLKAGPLSAVLEEGNLRAIRWGAAEAVRAVNYLARDSSWGTYRPVLGNFLIGETADAFELSYNAVCEGVEGRYGYRMTIRGEASGRLTMEAVGEALTDFPTNRTGFVVLHPAEAAGGALSVTHSDGSIQQTAFPRAISPDQPVFDIVALTHEPAPGLRCTVAMEGDAFEMEDQRNWADASFKTYVRPLSKPRPYTIGKGGRDVQRITISFEGTAPTGASAGGDGAVLAIGPSAGQMPELSMFVDPDEIEAALPFAASLGGARELILRFDPARGHDAATLRRGAELAAAMGGGLAVEAVFDMRDPRREAAAVAAALSAARVRPTALLIAPRREFKTRPSGSLPEGEVTTGAMVHALRAAGLMARIGAGSPSNFTEFNRNPPKGDADLVYFGVSSIVHAADDLSVSETVSVYPAIIDSARALCPGKPIWLGPCTIATRHNPYGAAVVPNPDKLRLPAARIDPRHAALFGAAFMIGVAAQAAEAEVERLILASPTGPFGLLAGQSGPIPAHAVHQRLAEAAGRERYRVELGSSSLRTVAFRQGDRVTVLLANLSEEETSFAVQGKVLTAHILEPNGFQPLAFGLAFPVAPYRSLMLTVEPDRNR